MTTNRFVVLVAAGILLGGMSSSSSAQLPVRTRAAAPTLVVANTAPLQRVDLQRPVNLDFTTFSSEPDAVITSVTDPTPVPSPRAVTVAIDSVTGSDSNPGTLNLPKRSLQQPAPNGAVFGLYRDSLFRESLPFGSLGTTHDLLVEDLLTNPDATGTPLPIISALDLAVNGSFTSNGDGSYTYMWMPTDGAVANDGYSNVYVVEVNTATEAGTPVASRRRMTDVPSAAAVSSTVGSAWIQNLGGGTWRATLHPSDNLAPGSGTYRYEVVSRVQPANWGSYDTNAGDGAMSGVVLVGGSSGYGCLGGPRAFTGDRLAFVHASTHNAVIAGGSLQRSVFYEAGNPAQCIQLAWYAGQGAGLRWDTRHCLFYANVGNRPANGLISHTAGNSFDRGDLSDTAFIGARWSDGSLHGTAIDYENVATGNIERVYVQAVRDIFGFNMPLSTEVKNSVFRQVGLTRVGGNFHDNIVLAETISDPANPANYPLALLFQQNGASATNNLLWARGITGSTAGNGEVAGGINYYNNALSNCTCQRNIIVLNPGGSSGVTYYNPGSSNTASMSVDYNLIINLSKAGFHAEGGAGYYSFAAYQAGYPTLDQHSLYFDLSADPRGLQAVFMDPLNGDFRWAQTDVATQCAAYCQANHVGPATVPSRWPLVPTVDEAVKTLSSLR